LRWPEELGPFSETPGQDYGSPGMPTIGRPPPLLDPATRDRENAERERKHALRQQIEAAALTAARDAMTASTLTAQVFADVDAAVERAVSTPAQDPPGTPAEPEKPRRPHRRVRPAEPVDADHQLDVDQVQPEPGSP